MMQPTAGPTPKHVTTRVICALLAIGFLAALVVAVVTGVRSGQVPTVGTLVSGLFGLLGTYQSGRYAIEGPAPTETGVLAEPSEIVRHLAIQPRGKIEAIRAYREQTGVDVKRARQVVERLAAVSRAEA
jgi:hypothetical protein